MKSIFLFSVLIGVVGCTSNPVVVAQSNTVTSPASNKKLEQEKNTISIDRELFKPCSTFTSLEYINPTPNQVLQQKAKDVAVLNECAKRHRSLVKIVKDAFNIQD